MFKAIGTHLDRGMRRFLIGFVTTLGVVAGLVSIVGLVWGVDKLSKRWVLAKVI